MREVSTTGLIKITRSNFYSYNSNLIKFLIALDNLARNAVADSYIYKVQYIG